MFKSYLSPDKYTGTPHPFPVNTTTGTSSFFDKAPGIRPFAILDVGIHGNMCTLRVRRHLIAILFTSQPNCNRLGGGCWGCGRKMMLLQQALRQARNEIDAFRQRTKTGAIDVLNLHRYGHGRSRVKLRM